jgi:hypothetical protein
MAGVFCFRKAPMRFIFLLLFLFSTLVNAQTKLSSLSSITSAQLASNDLTYIADVSVSQTKSITFAELDSRWLSSSVSSTFIYIGDASGTATARSISGDASLSNLGILTLAPGVTLSSPALSGTMTGGVYTGTVSGTGVFLDNLFTLQDNSTPTKKGQFNVSAVTAGQTRQYDLPDQNGTVALLNQLQTFSVSQTFSADIIANSHIIIANGKCIDFSGTANSSGTTTSEQFCDAEKGTFTPVYVGAISEGTTTYSTQSASYSKVNDVVCVGIRMVWSAQTGSGDVRIKSLPFTIRNTTHSYGVSLYYMENFALSASNVPWLYLIPNSATATIYQMPVGGGSVTNVTRDTAADIGFGGCYFTDQ